MCCLTSLWLCALLLLGRGFLLLPACPSPFFGLWAFWFDWLLFFNRVPYLRNEVTPAGSRIVCPRSERRFGLSIVVGYTGPFLAGPPASVCGYLRARSSRCVARWCSPDRWSASRFAYLALSPVIWLSCRLGGFSFGRGFRLFLSVLLGLPVRLLLPSLRLRVSEGSSLSA